MGIRGPKPPRPLNLGLKHSRREYDRLALLDQAHRLATAIGEPVSQTLLEVAPRLLNAEEFDDLVEEMRTAKQAAGAQIAPATLRPAEAASPFASAGDELEEYLRSLEIREGRR